MSDLESRSLGARQPMLTARGGYDYVPNMEMAMSLTAARVLTSFAAIENAGRETGPDPRCIPSERCGGESRRETLKRKAAHISRSGSTSKVFAYCTTVQAEQSP